MSVRPIVPKPCPVCGVAMVASKADEESRADDIFTCLNCDFVLTHAPPAAGDPPGEPGE